MARPPIMLTITIEVVLGALLALVIMNLFKRKPTPSPSAPQPDLANLKPTDARTGDVISISGAGDNMTDLDFTVDRSTWYHVAARNWFEVSGPYRERRVSMRVANEEEIEVTLQNDARKLSLNDLGVSEEDLAEIDERQNPADSFEFDGAVWLYRQSADATAKRDDQPQPTGFYYWEFREQNGKRLLSVRKPQGEPFAVSLYSGVPVGDVTVYRRG
jgi:hypothetical protein